MISFMLLAIIGTGFFLFGGLYFKGKEILKIAGILLVIASSIFLFIWFMQGDLPKEMYFISILIILFGFFVLIKIRKEKSNTLKIIANQHRYWKEITPSDIYSFFHNRKQEKKDRIEIKVNRDRKKIYFNSKNSFFIAPSFFLDLDELNLTKTTNYKDINNSILYRTIFKKLKGIIEDKEITKEYDTFFQEILNKNGNYLEYFLIYIWEEYTRDINIGSSYLELLAINNTEKQLVGALNISSLHNIVFNGSALYFAYMNFHQRIFPSEK